MWSVGVLITFFQEMEFPVSKELCQLKASLLTANAKDRPTASEALTHAVFSAYSTSLKKEKLLVESSAQEDTKADKKITTQPIFGLMDNSIEDSKKIIARNKLFSWVEEVLADIFSYLSYGGDTLCKSKINFYYPLITSLIDRYCSQVKVTLVELQQIACAAIYLATSPECCFCSDYMGDMGDIFSSENVKNRFFHMMQVVDGHIFCE